MKEIVFDKTDAKWTTFDDQDITLTTPLPAGEYLFVMTNFKDTSWAICNFLFSANPGFKVYKNGEAAERSLWWQLVFEDEAGTRTLPFPPMLKTAETTPAAVTTPAATTPAVTIPAVTIPAVTIPARPTP